MFRRVAETRTTALRRLALSGQRFKNSAEEASRVLWRAATRLRRPHPHPQPFVAGETPVGNLVLGPGLLGLVGMLLVLWGASQTTSPFTLNRYSDTTLPSTHLPFGVEMWFFGTGPVQGHENVFLGVIVGVVAVYTGMFLVVRAWMGLIRVTRLHPGIPVRRVVPVFIMWLIPMLVVAPLFSHDAYSYVAQGEQVSFHISPYKYSPSMLGVGGSSIPSLVDRLWTNVTSPYGPVFLWLAGVVVSHTGHAELASLVGFRLLALAGTALLAVFIPRLARSYGCDPAKAFVLVALNPIVLFHLVAGEHNDALLLGLLVAGLSLAKDRHPIIGIVLCSLAALVKVPALIGVVYIGWDWRGDGLPIKRRLSPTALAMAISGAVMGGVTWATGLGWGWLAALRNPGTVTSWMDPGTGLGGLIARAVNAVGLGEHSQTIVSVTHTIALGIAAVIGIRLLLKADGIGVLRAIGLTLIAVVVLGPVVQPWYFIWGIALLAPIAEGKTRAAIVALSAVMAFLGLPGAKRLVTTLGRGNPLVILLAVVVLIVVALIAFAPEVRHLLIERRRMEATANPEDVQPLLPEA